MAESPTLEALFVDEIFDAPTSFPVPEHHRRLGGKKGPHNIPFVRDLSHFQIQRLLDLSGNVEHFLQLVRESPSP